MLFILIYRIQCVSYLGASQRRMVSKDNTRGTTLEKSVPSLGHHAGLNLRAPWTGACGSPGVCQSHGCMNSLTYLLHGWLPPAPSYLVACTGGGGDWGRGGLCFALGIDTHASCIILARLHSRTAQNVSTSPVRAHTSPFLFPSS